ncbi:MAG: phosphoribosylglycinamide formyltransferase [Candidatus Magnetobacterium sp. LHC-1]|uniref:Phosphoribosylglycinamide formyltransferase n=1 Tax=Candidatus Magnetobacterium casense TaxID=1455061 RepID=A0ABS6S2J7_9BACT|nr:phosphoribosylglycinamide formyltransferase [Candidatus Magnetobacterium casensis]MBF0606209.1 phosphoribosylglycinamide formyltransferase [Nitrospirota bacterium]MBV6343069.1 phosphoribosylglycinamide formyltransferase [Candidatus Magnetobacterium casensis]
MLKLAVLASGRGSNFQAIIDAKNKGALNVDIVCLLTDNPNAYAITRATDNNISHIYINPRDYATRDDFFRAVADELSARLTELIALAGFMRIVTRPLIEAFPMRILNIHPALLPSFKGLHAQRQAIEAGVKVSGCTVHFVDEGMDTGPIIVQAPVPVSSDDNEETLSEKILRSEHVIYPYAIRLFAEGRLQVHNGIVSIKPAGGEGNVEL